MMELDKIYCEPCIETLRRMEDNSVDCVITSPPYFNLRCYTDDPREIGREVTPQEYIDNMIEIFREIYRVLKPEGTVWVNIADTYAGNKKDNSDLKWESANNDSINKRLPDGYKRKDLIGIPWQFAFAMRDRLGFYLRQDIIWDKSGNAMPEPVKDRCVKAHEYIFLFSKSDHYYFDYEAIQEPSTSPATPRPFGSKKGDNRNDSGTMYKPKMKNLNRGGQKPNTMHLRWAEGFSDVEYTAKNKRDVWHVNTKPSGIEHCAMYPEELIEPCVLAGCPENGVVYDPFGGAATTALVVLRAGGNRRFVCSELNPDYVAIAEKRLEFELKQLKLF